MKRLNIYRSLPIWLLVFFLLVPLQVHADEDYADTAIFSQEELDQILAPVALYPDALLGQVMMAATYPLEVVMADRWLQQNKDLKGDEFEEALDAQQWDPSVKALTAFPDLLTAMSENPEWMQNLGDAFLVQQADVMDTVQKLRKKAYEAGNLKTTAEQKVTTEKEIIKIESADPKVVYVPVYDPWWVYGPWWWHAYPPYVVYPHYAGVVIAPGHIWFSVGFLVGAFWGNWGYCDWPHHHVYVRPYHYRHHRQYAYHRTPAGRNVPGRAWTHDPSHRRGVAYRGRATSSRFGQVERRAADNTRTLTTFRQEMARRNGPRGATVNRPGRTPGVNDRPNRPTAVSPRRPEPREPTRNVGPIKPARPFATVDRGARPDTLPPRDVRINGAVNNPPADTGRNPYVFGGAGWNSQAARQHSWGQSSPSAGARTWSGSLGRSLGGARGNSRGSRNGGLFTGTMRGGRR